MQWDKIAKNFRPRGRTDACRVDVVFQRDGDAVERAAITMPLAAARSEKFRFCFFGLGESKFSGDGEVSVEFGIEPLDAGEHELGDLDGRKLAFAEEFSDFLDRREGQVGVVHGCHINHKRRYPDSGWVGTGAARCCTIAQLEDSFLVTEIPEVANVRDDEREAELILRAHLPEVDAAIFDGEATAAAVVTELNDLVLQRLVLEIVAQAGDEIKAFAGFASVADQPANLVRKRLLEVNRLRRRRERKIAEHRVGIQAEVGNRGEKFPIRPYFQERAYGDESLNLGIVMKNLLQIVVAARSDLEIADDRRPVAGTESESERRNRVDCLENIALAVDDSAAKGGIKIVLLNDAPGDELLRLAITVLPEEPLRKAIFDFAGVGERGIGIKTNKIGEAIHAGDVAVGERRFDGVLVPVPSLVLFQGTAFEESFERRRAELDGELAGVAGDRSATGQASGSVGIAIAGGAENGGSGHAEQRTEMQWKGYSWRQFVAIDQIGSLNILIAPAYGTGK